jgi:hypothetical protein
MADTGNPWFIPFAEPSDLVRDWPALSSAVGTAVAAGLTAANVGIGSNVVQTVKTDTFTSTSTSFVDIDGLSVTITPSADTSKVLVIANLNLGMGSTDNFAVRLMRGSTAIYVGDVAGSRIQATAMTVGFSSLFQHAVTPTFLDSPNSNTATTYSLQMRVNSSTGVVNRSSDDTDSANRARTASSITVIEVKA